MKDNKGKKYPLDVIFQKEIAWLICDAVISDETAIRPVVLIKTEKLIKKS